MVRMAPPVLQHACPTCPRTTSTSICAECAKFIEADCMRGDILPPPMPWLTDAEAEDLRVEMNVLRSTSGGAG